MKVYHHPHSPSVPPTDVKGILAVFCRLAHGVHILCIQIQHFFRREEQWGVCVEGEKTLGLFVKSFLPNFRGKQHIFSHHTGRNGTNTIIARTHSIKFNCRIKCRFSKLLSIRWNLPCQLFFCFRKCPSFFFSMQKNMDKIVWKSTPPRAVHLQTT